MLTNTQSFNRWFAKQCEKCGGHCCWSCHHILQNKTNQFFCDECHKIQPPHCNNYFSMFQQPTDFNIDVSALEKRYRQYQALVHPDHFLSKSKQELEYSDRVSECVNKGFETLKNPLSRAEYILGLNKISGTGNVPPEFLQEVLEIHEKIEETTDIKELSGILHKIEDEIEKEKKQLSESLKIVDKKLKDPNAACIILTKLRYFNRIREAIREKIPASEL